MCYEDNKKFVIFIFRRKNIKYVDNVVNGIYYKVSYLLLVCWWKVVKIYDIIIFH